VSFRLPALKSLGELSEREPVIVIDTHELEQSPFSFQRLPVIVDALPAGDYSVAGLEDLFVVERKTVLDLWACCAGPESRLQFEREMYRLRGYAFRRLLVIGTEQDIRQGKYYSGPKDPEAVLSMLYSLEARYNMPIVFAASPPVAALKVERWTFYFSREAVAAVNDLWRATTPELAILSP
jgi:ERCC4-type nuclease